MVTTKKKLKSPLLDKKVKIALLSNNLSPLYGEGNELGTLATGGKKDFGAPPNARGHIVNPLTNDEQEFFEDLLGIDLNPHLKRDNFWRSKQAKCILKKSGRKNSTADITLNLNDPYDYILWKIALINPRVANSWAERDKEGKKYEFVIIDGEVQLEEELSYTKKEDAVQEYLITNKNSKKKLFDLLRMYGVEHASKQVGYNSSTEWIYNELKKAARRKSEVEKLYSLVSLGAKDVSDKVFLQDCVTAGVVEKIGTEYRIAGGDKIGINEYEAIHFLNEKRHQSIKARFESAIEEYYKENK